MGLRGKPPKPISLKILGNNPGNRPAVGASAFPVGTPEPPDWLDAEALEEWQRIVPELEAAGFLSRVDRSALAAYCQAYAELEITTQLLQVEGRIVNEPIQNAKGELLGERKKAHPVVRLQRDAFARLKTYLVEFGLSPGSRSRIQSTQQGGSRVPANRLSEIGSRVQASRETAS